jgi:hypothetical protein
VEGSEDAGCFDMTIAGIGEKGRIERMGKDMYTEDELNWSIRSNII